MVYLDYIPCLRYTILVQNPRIFVLLYSINTDVLYLYLSRSLADRWGINVDFTASFLHRSGTLKFLFSYVDLIRTLEHHIKLPTYPSYSCLNPCYAITNLVIIFLLRRSLRQQHQWPRRMLQCVRGPARVHRVLTSLEVIIKR